MNLCTRMALPQAVMHRLNTPGVIDELCNISGLVFKTSPDTQKINPLAWCIFSYG